MNHPELGESKSWSHQTTPAVESCCRAVSENPSMIPIWVLQLSRQGHRVDCWDVPRATEKPWLAACPWVFLCLSGIYPILEKLNLISPCITKQCGPFPKFERKHKRKQQFGRPFVVNIDLCIFSEFITLGGNTLIENHSYWNTNLTSFYPESTNLRLFRLVFMTVQWCSMFNLIFNVTDIDITRNHLGISWSWLRSHLCEVPGPQLASAWSSFASTSRSPRSWRSTEA